MDIEIHNIFITGLDSVCGNKYVTISNLNKFHKVATVKQIISQRFEIPMNIFNLIYSGKYLVESNNLEYYKIKNNCNITLKFKIICKCNKCKEKKNN